MRYHDETLELTGSGVILARFISRLTPAPLVNLYVGAIMAYASPIGLGPTLDSLSALLIVVIVMVVAPIVPIVYAAWRGRTDLDVSEQESRSKFLVFSLICYIIAVAIFGYTRCLILQVLAAAYFNVTLGVLIVNQRSKISVHGAGVGGPGTALLAVYGLMALPVVILWALVIWSRVRLKQHNFLQAAAGVLLGVLITWPTYLVLY